MANSNSNSETKTDLKDCKFLCINLEKDVRRKIAVEKLAEKLNIEIEFVDGQSGSMLNVHHTESHLSLIETESNWYVHNKTARPELNLSCGEMGCAISHLNVCDKIKKGVWKDYKYYIVFEDDIQIAESSLQIFKEQLANLPQPDLFDVCLLSSEIQYFVPEITEPINEFFSYFERKSFNMANALVYTQRGADIVSTCSQNGIDKIESSVKLTGFVNVPADDHITRLYLKNLLKVITANNRVCGTDSSSLSVIWNIVKPNEDWKDIHKHEFHKDLSNFITMDALGQRGRLGNQMFQYAFLKCVQLQSNIPLKLSDACASHLSSVFQNIKYTPSNHEQILQQIDATLTEDQTLPHTDFVEQINKMDIEKKHINFIGYFQSEKYFESCEDVIKHTFKFKNSIQEESLNYINGLKQHYKCESLIALHIRLGDIWHSKPNERVYPVITKEYINQAISTIVSKSSSSNTSKTFKIVIFTDSPELVNKVYDKTKNSDVIDICSKSDYHDMCAMSLCDHFILSCSSFSWWAAWLCKNLDRIVVCPQPWYNTKLARVAQIDTTNIIPHDWMQIDLNLN